MRRGWLTMVEARRQFGISRKPGQEVLHRKAALGPEGLRDEPRAVRAQANQTSPGVEGAVLRVRNPGPSWWQQEAPGHAAEP